MALVTDDSTTLELSNAPPSEKLPAVLGLFDAITIVVGSIIGSGIFLKASTVAQELPMFGPIMLIWIGVGLVTLCGALALGELAAMLPQAGGPYVYLREAYGRLPAFLWGWTEFWIIRTGSIGALACATTIYLNQLVPIDRLTQELIAIGIVVGLSGINIVATRWGANVQNITSIIKVAFLAALILLPILLQQESVANLDPVWPTSTPLSFWRAMGVVMIAVLWPYDGWINIAPVAEEIRNPQRNVPWALAIGMLLIITIYAGTNATYHLVLPMDQVAGSAAVASDVWRALFSETGAMIAALGVMCSTFGAVNSNMLAGPRIYFAMARDGLLPAGICRVHGKFQTPANAIVMQCAWTCVLLMVAYAWKAHPVEAFDALTDFVIFGGQIFYAMAVGAVFVLRRKRPELHRPYKTWGYPVTPALYLAAFVAALVALLLEKWAQTFAGTALIIAGVIFYQFATRREARRNASISGDNL